MRKDTARAANLLGAQGHCAEEEKAEHDGNDAP